LKPLPPAAAEGHGDFMAANFLPYFCQQRLVLAQLEQIDAAYLRHGGVPIFQHPVVIEAW